MDKTLGNVNADEVYETKIEPVKNKLRLEYANNASFGLDLVILIVTFLRIFGLNESNARKIILFFYPNLDLRS